MKDLRLRWVEALAIGFVVSAIYWGTQREPIPPSVPVPLPTPCIAARLFVSAIPYRTGLFFTWGMPLDFDGRLIAYAECPNLQYPVWSSVGAAGCYIVPHDLVGGIQIQPWSVDVGGPPGATCTIKVAAEGLEAEKEIRIPRTATAQPPHLPSP